MCSRNETSVRRRTLDTRVALEARIKPFSSQNSESARRFKYSVSRRNYFFNQDRNPASSSGWLEKNPVIMHNHQADL